MSDNIARSIPAWVNWLAQDADGAWWGYECEPNRGDYSWYENEIGRVIALGKQRVLEDWRKSLRPR